MATTVLPVPAPPVTRAGPLKGLVTSLLLARMQEDSPLLQRGIEDRIQFLVGVDRHEAAAGVGVLEGQGQVSRIHIFRKRTTDP